MLIETNALNAELPALKGMPTQELCELLAGLGFPVDGVETGGDSPVLEVDITANRGDAQSHRGLARDLAAKLGAELRKLKRDVPVRIYHPTPGDKATMLPQLKALGDARVSLLDQDERLVW